MANASEILRGEGYQNARLGNITTITDSHKLIHEGRLYFISDASTTADPSTARIKTGAKYLHAYFKLQAGLKTAIQIIEAPTITVAGTAVPFVNYNRNFTDDNLTAKAYKGSTYTGGTAIKTTQAGFGSAPGNAQTGSERGELEYCLKPNTEYIILATPAASTDLIFEAVVYEV